MIKEEYPSQPSTTEDEEQDSFFSLRTIVDLLIGRWYWFLISVVSCLFLMAVYISTIPPTYQHEAVVMIKSDDKTGVSSEMSAFLELSGQTSGFSNVNMLENELYVMRSTPLISEVVERLRLNVNYSKGLLLRKESLFDESPISINFLDPINADEELQSFTVTPIDAKTCNLSDFKIDDIELDWAENVAYNKIVATPIGRLIIQPVLPKPDSRKTKLLKELSGETEEEDRDYPVYVTRISPRDAALLYQENITTELLEETSLITLTCKDDNLNRTDSVLQALIDVYNRFTLEDKNRVAENTERFIDQRINVLAGELGKVDEALAQIKSQNKIIDFQNGAATFLNEGARAKENLASIEAQVMVAKYLSDYLNDASKENELIPELAGDDMLSSAELISSYNEMMLRRNRAAEYSSMDAPVVADMTKSLKELRASIRKSIDASVKTLNIRLAKARQVEAETSSIISSVPTHEKTALDATRQQAIKESLYSFLLTKREENAIKMAITEPNARLIEPPSGSEEMASPKRGMMLLAAFAIGLVIPFAFLYIVSLLDTKVRGRKDIEDMTTLPILAEIPSVEDDRQAYVKE